MWERTEVLTTMGELELYGMSAYDETLARAVKRQHEPQHLVVLVGGTGTGKRHLAIAIAPPSATAGGEASSIRRSRNKLEAEARAERRGRMAAYLTRLGSSSSTTICFSRRLEAGSCSI